MKAINIFWIEDNVLVEHVDDIAGIPYPSFEISFAGDQLFRFFIFQHPEEIKEYLEMVHTLEARKGTYAFCDCEGLLPDLVVFDYKLSDNFNTTNDTSLQYSYPKHHAFITEHYAAQKIKAHFDIFSDTLLFKDRPDVLGANYKSDTFKNALGVKNIQGIDDEFGLYSGIAIIREFKDYISLGVPATLTKADKNTMSENSLYFEWLNGYDLSDAIKRFDKDSKSWDDILVFALPLLRERIINQNKAGAIHISYPQISRLANTTEDNKESDAVFSFTSRYGKRDIYLSALFADIPEVERDQAITDWAERLQTDLAEKVNIERNSVTDLIKKAEEIFTYYKNHFTDRILLSLYSVMQTTAQANKQSSKLQPGHLENFSFLKESHTRNGEIIHEYSIDTVLGKHASSEEFRLVTLLLCTRLYINHKKVGLPNATNQVSENINFRLQHDDYYNVLYPFVNSKGAKEYNALHLIMHDNTMTPSYYYSAFGNRLTAKISPNLTPANWSDIKNWISPGEKQLVQAVFQHELTPDNTPDWLN